MSKHVAKISCPICGSSDGLNIFEEDGVRTAYEPIKGLDKYTINRYGCIRNRETGNILKSSEDKGYLRINLTGSDGLRKRYVIHRLVAMNFIPNPDNLPQVNHKDGNKTNNRVENLEWCTLQQNIQHAVDNNFLGDRRGNLNGFSKLDDWDVRFIKHWLYEGYLHCEIAKVFKVTPSNITCIARGKTWKHVEI